MPGVAAVSAFVKGGEGRGEREIGILLENGGDLPNFGEGGSFGFIGDREASEVRKRRKMLFTAFFKQVGGKGGVVGGEGGANGGVVRLVGLDNDVSGVEVAASDTADNLGEELKSMLFSSKIR